MIYTCEHCGREYHDGANVCSSDDCPGSMLELEKLWAVLKDVPVCDDEIQEPFLHFSTGTVVQEIWLWFESMHPDFKVHTRL